MRRVVSVWLPTWQTDRQRLGVPGPERPPKQPLVTALHDGRRRIVATADMAARALGLHAGQSLAQARAMVPDLVIAEAEPAADADALDHLAAGCLRFTPLTRADPPDGMLLDVTGCTHLFGGEPALLARIARQLASGRLAVRLGLADTPAAAYAIARHGAHKINIVPPGGTALALHPLPIAALRLPEETVTALHRLGFKQVGDLAETARAPLTRRFGPALLLQLDQALGRVSEPVQPVFPLETIQHRVAFAEPLMTAEAFAIVNRQLVEAICLTLERTSRGGRRFDLIFERVDGSTQFIRIGTAHPARGVRHLTRLLNERIEQIDPGLGVDAMRLVVPWAEPLAYAQAVVPLADAGDGTDPACLVEMVDRLQNRLGAERVWRASPIESDVPERSTGRVLPLSPPSGATWPAFLPRPSRLFDPPQPVETLALLPDHPPVAFTWRRLRHPIRRADGPERIHGEWWQRDGEVAAVRDYFRVEDETGRRFWLFRRGDGTDPETGDLRWFLHGVF